MLENFSDEDMWMNCELYFPIENIRKECIQGCKNNFENNNLDPNSHHDYICSSFHEMALTTGMKTISALFC